jgi:hypothetical protein
MKKILLILCINIFAFALTPFSLEGLHEAKVKISDKGKLLTKIEKKQLTAKIILKLQKTGLKTDTKLYSKIIIKVKSLKLKSKSIILISLFVIEDVRMLNDIENIKMAITYKMDDFFEAEDLKEDVTESIEYLVSEFIEQYNDEK